MGFDDNQGGTPKQLHNVTSLGITCTECQTPITELPFEPNKRQDGTYGKIYCRECLKNRPRRY